jgi:hypothetical protein
MKFAIRKKFLDLAWTAADLDSAAEFWLRLYEAAARSQSFSSTPDHVTELRLRGFPRAEGELLADELARRAPEADFRRPVVELTDPDTITLVSDLTDGAESAPAGLGLPLLEGPGFDGLMVEFRFTAAGAEGKLIRNPRLSFTLVLVGQVEGGVFVLKTLWRTGSSEWEDEVSWQGGDWEQEREWLSALEQFRDTAAVPLPLAKAVCVPRDADRFAAMVVKAIHVPLGQPRLGGLLVRVPGFALAVGLVALAWVGVVWGEVWLAALPLAAVTWLVLWVLWRFVRIELHLWFAGYRAWNALYSQLLQEGHRLVPPSPRLAKEMEDNPAVRKYTADLHAAGFAYMGDLVGEPQIAGEGVYRVFRAPDGATYLALVVVFTTAKDPEEGLCQWPCQVGLMAHTIFADGGYAASINGRSSGYRRKRTGPDVFVRIFPDETDPLEFVRLHARAAREFAEATGRRALKHESFADYTRRQEAMLDDERRLFTGSPYTWGDHLWWYLQTPRRVYLG